MDTKMDTAGILNLDKWNYQDFDWFKRGWIANDPDGI